MSGVAKRRVGGTGEPGPNGPFFSNEVDGLVGVDFQTLREQHRELLGRLAKIAAIVDMAGDVHDAGAATLEAADSLVAESTDYLLLTSPDASGATLGSYKDAA